MCCTLHKIPSNQRDGNYVCMVYIYVCMVYIYVCSMVYIYLCMYGLYLCMKEYVYQLLIRVQFQQLMIKFKDSRLKNINVFLNFHSNSVLLFVCLNLYFIHFLFLISVHSRALYISLNHL